MQSAGPRLEIAERGAPDDPREVPRRRCNPASTMRAILLTLTAIVLLWAGFLSISSNFDPFDPSKLVASAVLTLGVVLQRLSSIQHYLSPRKARGDRVHALAQEAVLNICAGERLGEPALSVMVHVWEVPLWYRRLFPYRLRRFLRRVGRHPRLSRLARRHMRPRLTRLAAAGLIKRGSSGIVFRKRVGLVGVCIAENQDGKILSHDITAPNYQDALASEEQWAQLPETITFGLTHEEAKTLAHRYHLVIATVAQSPTTGEAIGCITISVGEAPDGSLRFVKKKEWHWRAKALARTVSQQLSQN